MSKRVYPIKFLPIADVAPGDRVQVTYNTERYTGTVLRPYNERFHMWRVQPDDGGAVQVVNARLMKKLATVERKAA